MAMETAAFGSLVVVPLRSSPEVCSFGTEVQQYLAAFRELRKNCGFTAAEREELEALFQKFDVDESGLLSTEELRRVLKYMGYNPTDHLFDELVAQAQRRGGIHCFLIRNS